MSELLTSAEHSVLTECEAVIERGMNTFVEVGQALTRVRDSRLYRAEHRTFEDYLERRWNMSRPRAYELINAARTVSAIADKYPDLPAPSNEGQARELGRVPEQQRAEVWERVVVETDGKPTAAAIREAATPPPAAPLIPPQPAASPKEAERQRQEQVDADHARRVSETLRRIVTYCAEGLSGEGLREEYVRIYQHQNVPGYLAVTTENLRLAGDSLHALADLWKVHHA